MTGDLGLSQVLTQQLKMLIQHSESKNTSYFSDESEENRNNERNEKIKFSVRLAAKIFRNGCGGGDEFDL